MQTITNRLAVDAMAEYMIRIQGHLNENWSDRMGGVSIQVQNRPNEAPVTELTGTFRDQAALTGVLNTLYDLGFPLLSVECLHIYRVAVEISCLEVV